MKTTSKIGTLCLAVGILAASSTPALCGELKPCQGWSLFPPTTGADFASYSVRHDNIGGLGLRRAVTLGIQFPDPFTMVIHEAGVLTYPNGDQLFDDASITLYFSVEGLVLGGAGDVLITGGTGRFEDAEGWASIDVSFDPPLDLSDTEPFRIFFEGEVSTVGSLKRK
jgi:hypothetical protein